MAVYRDRPCPTCKGSGRIYKNVITETGGAAWSEVCTTCNGVGMIKVAMTNSERIQSLSTPEDQLKFLRGFDSIAKYSAPPRRLLDTIDYDEDLLEWLNKVSDETDDYIFENR